MGYQAIFKSSYMSTIIAKPLSEKFSKNKKITFENSKSTFFTVLKKRVKEYHTVTGKPATGSSNGIFKALFFLITYIGGFVSLLFFPLSGPVALFICFYMGFSAAAIGFNLMHDGAHGSFSSNQWFNRLAAYSINLLGGDAVLWKNKHNMIHHTYTNLEGYDQDIALEPVLRSCISQKKLWFHKYQHIYCFIVYGLSSVLWIFVLDFIKYFTGKVGNITITGMRSGDHLVFWSTKILYIGIYLVLPASIWGWSYTVAGFFVYHIVLGTILSVVFQLAHVVEDTEFTDQHFESDRISDEWAIHQVKTTANFATANKWVTWYTGGLNFQVEHHLFPKISHVHYPELNKITKQVCTEMNVAYNEYPSFAKALRSHLSYLRKTGRAN